MKVKIGEVSYDKYDAGLKDAVHSPCILARSYNTLSRAEYVKFTSHLNEVVEPCEEYEAHGIVDPFLKENVTDNVAFWVFLKPESVSNLTHQFDFNVDNDPNGCKSMGCQN